MHDLLLETIVSAPEAHQDRFDWLTYMSKVLLNPAGDIYVPTSAISGNQFQVVAPGRAADGSQDQPVGGLAGTALGISSLLSLTAASSTSAGGGEQHNNCAGALCLKPTQRFAA